ncbi:zincin-like metallopeptidase domain-containing protein [Orbus sturtevantii]|uniref:zincin-like metallopeptidase domain-containing protein n=1 Tax=Orbus sturtevantii TaxID=3074109 RepID=UPI00370D7DBA
MMQDEIKEAYSEFAAIVNDYNALRKKLSNNQEELHKRENESIIHLVESEQNTPYCAITKKDFGEPTNHYLSFFPFDSNCWVDLDTAKSNGLSLKDEAQVCRLRLGENQDKYFINYEQLNEESKQKITLKSVSSDLTKTWQNIPELDHFIKNIGVKIYKNAYKTPFCLNSKVHMLPDNQFKNAEQYYSVLFHEIAHATSKELNRNSVDMKNDSLNKINYNKEELVAEFSSYSILKKLGMEDKLATAMYLDSYLRSSMKESHNIELLTGKVSLQEHVKYAAEESIKVINLIDRRVKENRIEQNKTFDLKDISNFLNNPNERSNLVKLLENRAQNPNEFNAVLKNYIIEATKENTGLNPPDNVKSYFANKTNEEKQQQFPEIVIDKINKKAAEVLQQARVENDNSKEIQTLKNSYLATSNHCFKQHKAMNLKKIEKNNSVTKGQEMKM